MARHCFINPASSVPMRSAARRICNFSNSVTAADMRSSRFSAMAYAPPFLREEKAHTNTVSTKSSSSPMAKISGAARIRSTTCQTVRSTRRMGWLLGWPQIWPEFGERNAEGLCIFDCRLRGYGAFPRTVQKDNATRAEFASFSHLSIRELQSPPVSFNDVFHAPHVFIR